MNISEMMVRDIRAEIGFNNEVIIVKNPKGEVKKELLEFFNEKIYLNSIGDNKIDEKEILRMLIVKLTNIKLDTEDLSIIFDNPTPELTRTMLYLSSIMQELIFETMANYNLKMRMNENTILEKDTLKRVNDVENMVKEIKHRKLVDGKEI